MKLFTQALLLSIFIITAMAPNIAKAEASNLKKHRSHKHGARIHGTKSSHTPKFSPPKPAKSISGSKPAEQVGAPLPAPTTNP